MEVFFSYIAGVRSSVIDIIEVMNEKRGFFLDRDYSTGINKIALIFVTGTMTTSEKKRFKIKSAKFSFGLAINFYLEEQDSFGKTLQEKATYLQLLVASSFQKHKRIQNQPFAYELFLADLEIFRLSIQD